MKQDQAQTAKLLPNPEDIVGFTQTNQNQPPSREDTNVFTNFEAELDEKQSSPFQKLLRDSLVVKPTSKNVKIHEFPVKIINNSDYEFYNFLIIHKNPNMQGFSERRLFTKYLGGKKQQKNQIKVKKWHFYEQTSSLLQKQQKKEQKLIKQQKMIKRLQEQDNYIQNPFCEDNQDENQLEENLDGIQKPRGSTQDDIDQEQVSEQEDRRGTDCIVISFFREWGSKLLAFTSKPQIRYRQEKQPQLFKELQFSIKNYQYELQLEPQLEISITEKGSFSFEVKLQITYKAQTPTLKRKHTVSLISKQVDRKLNKNPSYGQNNLAEMKRQVNSSIGSDKNTIYFANEQQIIKEMIKKKAKKKKMSKEDFEKNLDIKDLCFKQYDQEIEKQLIQAKSKINEDNIFLYQGQLGNCYMTGFFNHLQQVWPGYLQQRRIIMFDKQLKTICVALTINGSKVYIKTDYQLPCFISRQKDKQQCEYQLVFSYPSCIPESVTLQKLVDKHIKQQQQLFYADQKSRRNIFRPRSKIQIKYFRILSYMYVQKCIALYYGSYQALQAGNPAEIIMMLSDGITRICEGEQDYKYMKYFEEWQNKKKHQQDNKSKYVIIPYVRSEKHYQIYHPGSNQYFNDYFGKKNREVFYNHAFSFAGFQRVGNQNDPKHLIIKLRDYRRQFQENIKKLRDYWIKHQRNQQIYDQLKNIEKNLKSTQFLINVEDIKKLNIMICIGQISHEYHYSSRQILLKKGMVSHYKLNIVKQTDCQVILTQTHKRQSKTNTLKGLKQQQNVLKEQQDTLKEQYCKIGLELTLSPQIKLNIFQKHSSTIHISWLKCYNLSKKQYDLKIGLKQPANKKNFELVTLGFKTKNRFDEIQLASPTQIPLETQDIYCEQVKDFNFEYPQLNQVSTATPYKNNYFSIEHQKIFSLLELTIYDWVEGECFGQNFDIWMHKLDVSQEDYSEKTIKIHKMNYSKKKKHNEYSLLILNKQQFEPGFYKIIVRFKKDAHKKPKAKSKQMKMTFTIREKAYTLKELKQYTLIKNT